MVLELLATKQEIKTALLNITKINLWSAPKFLNGLIIISKPFKKWLREGLVWERGAISFKTAYSTLGTGLTIIGGSLAVLAYLVLRSTPLTGLGISTILIAAVSFAIGRGQPKIPPEASSILLQSGIENISAIIEELGLKSKGIYLPSSITGDKPKALIPLDSGLNLGAKVLPKRFIVKYGSKPEDVGLLIITPGSAVGNMVEAKLDYSAGDLESAISQVLSGTVNLADGAKVTLDAEKILVEVANPKLENNEMWIYESLGTPIASLVASVVVQVLDKPVAIESEVYSRGKCVIKLGVVGRGL